MYYINPIDDVDLSFPVPEVKDTSSDGAREVLCSHFSKLGNKTTEKYCNEFLQILREHIGSLEDFSSKILAYDAIIEHAKNGPKIF